MEEIKSKPIKAYFGACNSYSGFVSFFPEIFAPEKYERIYVIKGGPGTGKSSFMKRILSEFKDLCDAEAIYCSSDPNSLDGVILEKEGKRIALLDGTAPHETDAKIPGAVDEIINLGDLWDKKWLIPQREKILSINKEKKEAYKTAYHYLGIAGKCNDSEYEIYRSAYNAIKGRKKAFEIASMFTGSYTKSITKKLISSFGKNGIYRLKNDILPDIKLYNINLSQNYSKLFMKDLKSAFDALGIGYTLFPSAPDTSLYEAFYIEEKNAFIGNYTGGEDLDIGDIFENSLIINERARVAGELKKFALDEAQRHFAIASELHFSLEEMYSEAMNFEKVDAYYEKTKKEISDLLFS